MTDQVFDGEFWFLERHTPDAGLALKVREHIHTRRSRFQLIEVFDTFEYGRVLTLDRLIMVSERDESAYHEMLTHVPMMIHPSPRRVLVIGGGDGGVLRELVKHDCLQRAVQVEIDREVVEVCREYLPSIASAFDHPKVELVIEDAIRYIKGVEERFDVVIVDSTDPVGPAVDLFGEAFYRDVFAALSSEGIVTCQIGAPIYDLDQIVRMHGRLQGIFTEAALFLTHIPTYPSGVWTLGIASKGLSLSAQPSDVRYSTLRDRLNYYNSDIHRSSFTLPEFLHRALKGS